MYLMYLIPLSFNKSYCNECLKDQRSNLKGVVNHLKAIEGRAAVCSGFHPMLLVFKGNGSLNLADTTG